MSRTAIDLLERPSLLLSSLPTGLSHSARTPSLSPPPRETRHLLVPQCWRLRPKIRCHTGNPIRPLASLFHPKGTKPVDLTHRSKHKLTHRNPHAFRQPFHLIWKHRTSSVVPKARLVRFTRFGRDLRKSEKEALRDIWESASAV
jgi:hypothetical protein